MTAEAATRARPEIHVVAPFGAKEERFELRMPQLFELEDTLDEGVIVIYRRMAEGACRFKEIREVLRLGLIGGGKPPSDALKLVQRNHDDWPVETNLGLAFEIVSAAFVGKPAEAASADPAQAESA